MARDSEKFNATFQSSLGSGIADAIAAGKNKSKEPITVNIEGNVELSESPKNKQVLSNIEKKIEKATKVPVQLTDDQIKKRFAKDYRDYKIPEQVMKSDKITKRINSITKELESITEEKINDMGKKDLKHIVSLERELSDLGATISKTIENNIKTAFRKVLGADELSKEDKDKIETLKQTGSSKGKKQAKELLLSVYTDMVREQERLNALQEESLETEKKISKVKKERTQKNAKFNFGDVTDIRKQQLMLNRMEKIYDAYYALQEKAVKTDKKHFPNSEEWHPRQEAEDLYNEYLKTKDVKLLDRAGLTYKKYWDKRNDQNLEAKPINGSAKLSSALYDRGQDLVDELKNFGIDINSTVQSVKAQITHAKRALAQALEFEELSKNGEAASKSTQLKSDTSATVKSNKEVEESAKAATKVEEELRKAEEKASDQKKTSSSNTDKSKVSSSTTQTFDNEMQQDLVMLENYKNTIAEINRLKLEPETEETKNKITELNKLADYFVSKMSTVNENQQFISSEMMQGLYGWNERFQQYPQDKINEVYKLASDKYGLQRNLPNEFQGIDAEIKSIEEKSEGLRQSLRQSLQDSKKYVRQIGVNFANLSDFFSEGKTDKIERILQKFPELEQFRDLWSKMDADQSDDFVDKRNKKWLELLSMLPKAHEYLQEIGFDFKALSQPDKNGLLSGAENQIQQNEKLAESIYEVYRAYNKMSGIKGEKNISWFSTDFDTMMTYLKANPDRELIKGKIDFSKLLNIDANGALHNSITYLGDGSDEASVKITNLYNRIQELKNSLSQTPNDVLQQELHELELEYDKLSEETSNLYGTHTTNWFAIQAQEAGYLGIAIKNVIDDYNGLIDKPSTTIALFDIDQLENQKRITDEVRGSIEAIQKVTFDTKKAIGEDVINFVNSKDISDLADELREVKEFNSLMKLTEMTTEELGNSLREVFAYAHENPDVLSNLYDYDSRLVNVFDERTNIGKYFKSMIDSTNFGVDENQLEGIYTDIASKLQQYEQEYINQVISKLHSAINSNKSDTSSSGTASSVEQQKDLQTELDKTVQKAKTVEEILKDISVYAVRVKIPGGLEQETYDWMVSQGRDMTGKQTKAEAAKELNSELSALVSDSGNGLNVLNTKLQVINETLKSNTDIVSSVTKLSSVKSLKYGTDEYRKTVEETSAAINKMFTDGKTKTVEYIAECWKLKKLFDIYQSELKASGGVGKQSISQQIIGFEKYWQGFDDENYLNNSTTEAFSNASDFLRNDQTGQWDALRDIVADVFKYQSQISSFDGAIGLKIDLETAKDLKEVIEYVNKNLLSLQSNNSNISTDKLSNTENVEKKLEEQSKATTVAISQEAVNVNAVAQAYEIYKKQTEEYNKVGEKTTEIAQRLSTVLPNMTRGLQQQAELNKQIQRNSLDSYLTSNSVDINKFFQQLPNSKKGIQNQISDVLSGRNIEQRELYLAMMKEFGQFDGSLWTGIDQAKFDNINSNVSKTKAMNFGNIATEYITQWETASTKLENVRNEIIPIIDELLNALNLPSRQALGFNFDELLSQGFSDDNGIRRRLRDFINQPIETIRSIADSQNFNKANSFDFISDAGIKNIDELNKKIEQLKGKYIELENETLALKTKGENGDDKALGQYQLNTISLDNMSKVINGYQTLRDIVTSLSTSQNIAVVSPIDNSQVEKQIESVEKLETEEENFAATQKDVKSSTAEAQGVIEEMTQAQDELSQSSKKLEESNKSVIKGFKTLSGSYTKKQLTNINVEPPVKTDVKPVVGQTAQGGTVPEHSELNKIDEVLTEINKKVSRKNELFRQEETIVVNSVTNELNILTTLSYLLDTILSSLTKINNKKAININIKAPDDKDGIPAKLQTLYEALEKFEGIKIGDSFKLTKPNVENFNKIKDIIVELKNQLTGIDDSQLGFLNHIKDITANAQALSDLVKVLSASKRELAKMQEMVNTQPGSANGGAMPDPDLSNINDLPESFEAITQNEGKVIENTKELTNLFNQLSKAAKSAGESGDWRDYFTAKQSVEEFFTQDGNMLSSFKIGINDAMEVISAQVKTFNAKTQQTMLSSYTKDLEGNWNGMYSLAFDNEALINSQQKINEVVEGIKGKLKSLQENFGTLSIFKEINKDLSQGVDTQQKLDAIKVKMQQLDGVIKQVKQNAKGNGSLDPIVSMFTKMSTIDNTVDKLEANLRSSGMSAEEAANRISPIRQMILDINNIDLSQNDSITTYSEQFKTLNTAIHQTESALAVMRAKNADNSSLISSYASAISQFQKASKDMIAGKDMQTNAILIKQSQEEIKNIIAEIISRKERGIQLDNVEIKKQRDILAAAKKNLEVFKESQLGDYTKRANDVEGIVKKYNNRPISDRGTEYQKQLDLLSSQNSEINKLLSNGFDVTNPEQVQAFNALITKANEYADALKNLSNVEKGSKELAREKLANNILTWANKNPKAAKAFGNEIDTLLKQLKQLGANADVSNIATQFEKLKRKAIETNNVGLKFTNLLETKFKHMWASMLVQYFSIYDIIRYVRQGVGYIKELDTALTELKLVTNASSLALKNFTQEAQKMATSVATTTAELTKSTTEWARLGYSMDDALQLATQSAKLAKVGFMDVGNATTYMTSTLQAFYGNDIKNGLISAGEAAEKISDKFVQVGNNYAISAEGIGQALQRSSAALVAAGNDINKTIALTTAGNTIMQDPESMGSAMKIVSMRLRGTTASKLEAEGEDTEGVIENASKLYNLVKDLTRVNGGQGVSIIDTNTKAYKDTYTILLEISEVWDKMTDANQAALLEAIAGKMRGSAVAAILQNGDILRNAYEDALRGDEENVTETAMETALDSIESRMAKLKNTWQSLWQNSIDSKFLKDIVGFTNVIADLTNKLGGIPTIIKGIGVAYVGLKIKHSAMDVKSLATQIEGLNAQQAVEALRAKEVSEATISKTLRYTGLTEAEINEAKANATRAMITNQVTQAEITNTDATNTNTGAILNNNAAVNGSSNAQNGNIIARNNNTSATNRQTSLLSKNSPLANKMSMIGLGASLGTSMITSVMPDNMGRDIVSGLGSTLGLVGTGAMVGGVPGAIVGGVIGLAKGVYDTIEHRNERLKQQTEEIKDKFVEAQNAVKSMNNTLQRMSSYANESNEAVKKYAQLIKGVNTTNNANLNLSNEDYQEFLSISNELAEVFPELTKGYDDNGNAIIGLDGNINKIVGSLRELLQVQQDLAKQEYIEKMPDFVAGNLNKIQEFEKESDKYRSELKNIWDLYISVTSGKFERELNGGYASNTAGAETGWHSARDIYDLLHLLYSQDELNDMIRISSDGAGYHLQHKNTNGEIVKGLDLDDLYKRYIEYQKPIKEQINKVNEKIEKQQDGFGIQVPYVIADMSDEIPSDIKDVVTKAAKNINWKDIDFSDADTSDEKYEVYKKFIKDNIINPLNSIDISKQGSAKIDLNNLLTLQPTDSKFHNNVKEYLDYVQNIMNKFTENGEYHVTLPFDLEIGKDVEEAYHKFTRQVSKFSDEGQLNVNRYVSQNDILSFDNLTNWNKWTAGANTASQAIEMYKKGLEEVKLELLSINEIFTDEYYGVDKYQDVLSKVTDTLTKLSSRTLTKDEIFDLAQDEDFKLDVSNIDFTSLDYRGLDNALKDRLNTELDNLIKKIGDINQYQNPRGVKLFIENLKQMRDEALQTANALKDVNNGIASLEQISSTFDALSNTYATLKSGKELDFSAFSSLRAEFGDLDGFSDLANSLINAKEITPEIQKNFNIVATEYLKKQSEVFRDLKQDGNQDIYVSLLKKLGVDNSDEFINYILNEVDRVYDEVNKTYEDRINELFSTTKTTKQISGIDPFLDNPFFRENLKDSENGVKNFEDTLQNLEDATRETTGATYETINAFVNEATVTEATRVALAQMSIEKLNASGYVIDTSADINNLIALANTAKATTETIERLAKVEKLQANIDYSKAQLAENSHLGLEDKKAINKEIEREANQIEELLKEPLTFDKLDAADVMKEIDLSGFVNLNFDGGDIAKGVTKEADTVFDWIEVRLARLTEKAEKAVAKVTDKLTTALASKRVDKALDALMQKYYGNATAYARYFAEAEKFAIPEYYKSRIQEGEFDITSFSADFVENNKSLVDNIQKYKEWYDKARDCKNAMDELRSSVEGLAETLSSTPINRASEMVDKYTNSSNILDSRIGVISGYIRKNLYTAKKNSNEQKIFSQYNTAVDEEFGLVNKYRGQVSNWQNYGYGKAGIKAINDAKAYVSRGDKVPEEVLAALEENGVVQLMNSCLLYNASNDKFYEATVTAQTYAATEVQNKKANWDAIRDAKVSATSEAASSAEGYNYSLSQKNSALTAKNWAATSSRDAYASARSSMVNDFNTKNDNLYYELRKLIKRETGEYRTALQKAQSYINSRKGIPDNIVETINKYNPSLAIRLLNYNASYDAMVNAHYEEAINYASTSVEIYQNKRSMVDNKLSEEDRQDTVAEANKVLGKNASTKNKYINQEITNIKDRQKIYATDYANAQSDLLNKQQFFVRMPSNSSFIIDSKGKSYQTYINNAIKAAKAGKAISDADLAKIAVGVQNGYVNAAFYRACVDYNNSYEYMLEAKEAKELYDLQAKQEISTKTIEKLQNTSTERHKDNVDRSRVIGGIENLMDDDMLFDENKDATKYFTLQLSTTLGNLDNAQNDMKDYAKDLKDLNQAYANGTLTQDDYNARLEELQQSYLDSAKSVKEYRDKLVELYAKAEKMELDKINEVIDARKEALAKKKAYYDYDKQIKDKNKNIQALISERNAIEGVATAEAKAQRARLDAQIQDAQDELDDTVQEHIYSIQVEGLDDLSKTMTELYEKNIQYFKSSLDAQETLIKQQKSLVEGSAQIVKTALSSIKKAYGLDFNLAGLDVNIPGAATGGIITKTGIVEDGIMQLTAGETVLTNDFTRLLPDSVTAMNMFNEQMKKISTPHIGAIGSSMPPMVNIHYDNLINVNGSIDATVVSDMKKLSNDIVKQTITTISKDMKRNGVQFKM